MEMVKYTCKNVVGSGNTTENLSRISLLKWISNLLGTRIEKVEALCSGSAYCQIMNILFPGCIQLKKVKFGATVTTEFWNNFKQLQMAFRAVGCEKNMPIDALVKGGFQDNLEFLQWFNRFYELNCNVSTCASIAPKLGAVSQNVTKAKTRHMGEISRGSQENPAVREIKAQIAEYHGRVDKLIKEKDFYFHKLRNIEILCSSDEANVITKEALVNKIQDELYATTEGFEPPEED